MTTQSELETAFDVLNGLDKNPLWNAVIHQGPQLGLKGETLGETYLVIFAGGAQTSIIVKPGQKLEDRLEETRKLFEKSKNELGFLTFKMLAELMTAGGFIWLSLQVVFKLLAWKPNF